MLIVVEEQVWVPSSNPFGHLFLNGFPMGPGLGGDAPEPKTRLCFLIIGGSGDEVTGFPYGWVVRFIDRRTSPNQVKVMLSADLTVVAGWIIHHTCIILPLKGPTPTSSYGGQQIGLLHLAFLSEPAYMFVGNC